MLSVKGIFYFTSNTGVLISSIKKKRHIQKHARGLPKDKGGRENIIRMNHKAK